MPILIADVILDATSVEVEVTEEELSSLENGEVETIKLLRNRIKDEADLSAGNSYSSIITRASFDDSEEADELDLMYGEGLRFLEE